MSKKGVTLLDCVDPHFRCRVTNIHSTSQAPSARSIQLGTGRLGHTILAYMADGNKNGAGRFCMGEPFAFRA
jgi:hypothetical protein